MAARRIKRTSPTSRTSRTTSRTTSRAKKRADANAAAGGGHDHDHGDHDHEHPHGTGTDATVPMEFHAHLISTTDDELTEPLALYLFDEEERALCHGQVLSDQGKADVPRRVLGQMVTVAVAPVAAGRKEPTLDILRAREVPILRVLLEPVDRAIDLGIIRIDPRLFKRSCCRVRGRVVRRITLPSGQVIERPLCNARIVICEVDVSPRRILATLADDLVRQLMIEAADILPPPPGPPLAVTAAPTGVTVHVHDPAAAPHVHAPQAPQVHDHAAQTHVAVAAGTLLRSGGALVNGVAHLRDHLIANIAVLNRHWCRFASLFQRYDVDCIKTAPIGPDGRFDTDISYFCYGDRPDLYFKVEQGCGDRWDVVHAPNVACNTHWDYCCGRDVEIIVTSSTAGLGPAFSPCVPASSIDPATIGQWQLLPSSSDVFVVHAAVLRTGQVIMFSGGVEQQLVKESRLWDPVTGAFVAHTFADDLFCAFQVVLPDGRLLVMGGSKYNGPHGQGVAISYTFDPAAPGWTKHPDMAFGRWYPTAVVLDDGRVLVASGRAAGPVVSEMEIFSQATNAWSTLPASANKLLDIYPSLHLMAGGGVLYTGTRWAGGSSSPRPWPAPPDTALFDPAGNTWSDVATHVIPNRTEGTSVLLPPRASAAHHHGHGEEMPPPGTLSRVLVLGGDCGSPAERVSAEVIDLNDPDPHWTRIADMHHRRVNPNAVILADGTVLVCAGISGFKWDPDPGRVLEAEIFDPQSLTWRRAAVMSEGRQYHSVSVLLADGRVLNTGSVGGAGGGSNLLSMEVYSPPYLFRGPRPRITSYPTRVTRGGTLVITTPDACRIRRAALVRPGAPTHHTDSDQRYLPLDFVRVGRCDLHMSVPDGAGLLPPGYYMLFILDDCDVPSVAKFVHVS